ncbi:MAG TPA: TerB family tellurite resistance protein [Polyangiaceae bacterium]|nr:TerB family tellurite resistance protein [Polyangiaceae bacterium]
MKALNRQVFLALATVAWADGQLAPDERDGILQAARSAGFDDADVDALSKSIEAPVSLSSLDLRKLSALDRVFVYAMAEWLARIDNQLDPKEQVALDELGAFLMLSERVRTKARDAVQEIARLPTGNRPDRFDLVGLRSLLEQRM